MNTHVNSYAILYAKAYIRHVGPNIDVCGVPVYIRNSRAQSTYGDPYRYDLGIFVRMVSSAVGAHILMSFSNIRCK